MAILSAFWEDFAPAVEKERRRQIDLHGIQEHSWSRWSALLHEEYGEVGRPLVEMEFGGETEEWLRNLMEELVQVSALAASMHAHAARRLRLLEILKRNETTAR